MLWCICGTIGLKGGLDDMKDDKTIDRSNLTGQETKNIEILRPDLREKG